MSNRWLALVPCLTASILAPACAGTDSEGTLEMNESSEALLEAPIPRFCGGIAGVLCPTGETCVDNPEDTCDPERGGADCGGICVRRIPDVCLLRHGLASYVSRDPAECRVILFRCDPRERPFFDECGCGCERPTRR